MRKCGFLFHRFIGPTVLTDISLIRVEILNILRLLCKYQHRVPCILVLNKIDAMPE